MDLLSPTSGLSRATLESSWLGMGERGSNGENNVDTLTEKGRTGPLTLVVEEASRFLLVVGWNDSSNEEVCNGNEKNNQENHLGL